MWKQLLKLEDFHMFKYKTELTNLYNLCMNFNHNVNCYIHGGLGIWNLLFNNSDIYIIDFGEVRRGNNHLDVSAVLTSTIDWNRTDGVIMNSLKDFRAGYLTNFNDFSWKVLKENFFLWFTRGMIALLVNFGINKDTNEYVEKTIEKLKKIEAIIGTNNIDN